MPGKPNVQPAHLSANTLAFVGDAVFALYVRERLARDVAGTVHLLHKLSTRYVKASAQAAIVRALMPELSEEETHVFRRGRNVKTTTMPRNADMQEYRQATGFEALLGFLHLSGRQDRLMELLDRAASMIEQE
jgi:ribonuclease-3 family protein